MYLKSNMDRFIELMQSPFLPVGLLFKIQYG